MADITQTISDGLSFNDGVSETDGLQHTIQEILGVEDGAGLPQKIDDEVILSDALSKVNALLSSLSATLQLSDRVTQPLKVEDGLSLSDALSKAYGIAKGITDGVSLSDALSVFYWLSKTIEESLTLTDSVSGAVPPPKTIGDNLSLSDVLTILIHMRKTIAEAFILTDSPSRASYSPKTVSETLSLVDNIFSEVYRLVTDYLNLTDNLSNVLKKNFDFPLSLQVCQVTDFPVSAVVFTRADADFPISAIISQPVPSIPLALTVTDLEKGDLLDFKDFEVADKNLKEYVVYQKTGIGWSATKRTSNDYNKTSPQFVVDDKIYYIWTEHDGTHRQIWTASMNKDGTGWQIAKRTTSAYEKHRPQLVVDDKIYYVWCEYDGSHYQIWTAEMNKDGTGWNATKRTNSGYNKTYPQFDVKDDKIYYVWQEYDGNAWQVWIASMNTDGTDWSATKKTSSGFPYHNLEPKIEVGISKIYYLWEQYDGAQRQIWIATMNLDGTGWEAEKKTSDIYDKRDSQFQIQDNKVYYVWREYDTQWWLRTATMNTDGTGWNSERKVSTLNDKYNCQIQVTSKKVYCLWDEHEGTSERQIWIGEMDIDTDWHVTKETDSATLKQSAQFQIIGNKIYFVWCEYEGNHWQIWTAVDDCWVKTNRIPGPQILGAFYTGVSYTFAVAAMNYDNIVGFKSPKASATPTLKIISLPGTPEAPGGEKDTLDLEIYINNVLCPDASRITGKIKSWGTSISNISFELPRYFDQAQQRLTGDTFNIESGDDCKLKIEGKLIWRGLIVTPREDFRSEGGSETVRKEAYDYRWRLNRIPFKNSLGGYQWVFNEKEDDDEERTITVGQIIDYIWDNADIPAGITLEKPSIGSSPDIDFFPGEVRLENISVLQAMAQLLEMTGNYDMYMDEKKLVIWDTTADSYQRNVTFAKSGDSPTSANVRDLDLIEKALPEANRVIGIGKYSEEYLRGSDNIGYSQGGKAPNPGVHRKHELEEYLEENQRIHVSSGELIGVVASCFTITKCDIVLLRRVTPDGTFVRNKVDDLKAQWDFVRTKDFNKNEFMVQQDDHKHYYALCYNAEWQDFTDYTLQGGNVYINNGLYYDVSEDYYIPQKIKVKWWRFRPYGENYERDDWGKSAYEEDTWYTIDSGRTGDFQDYDIFDRDFVEITVDDAKDKTRLEEMVQAQIDRKSQLPIEGTVRVLYDEYMGLKHRLNVLNTDNAVFSTMKARIVSIDLEENDELTLNITSLKPIAGVPASRYTRRRKATYTLKFVEKGLSKKKADALEKEKEKSDEERKKRVESILDNITKGKGTGVDDFRGASVEGSQKKGKDDGGTVRTGPEELVWDPVNKMWTGSFFKHYD